jgi:hypothetical protein
LVRVVVIADCPTTCLKVVGLYFLADTMNSPIKIISKLRKTKVTFLTKKEEKNITKHSLADLISFVRFAARNLLLTKKGKNEQLRNRFHYESRLV